MITMPTLSEAGRTARSASHRLGTTTVVLRHATNIPSHGFGHQRSTNFPTTASDGL
jgi:hypothetical protein